MTSLCVRATRRVTARATDAARRSPLGLLLLALLVFGAGACSDSSSSPFQADNVPPDPELVSALMAFTTSGSEADSAAVEAAIARIYSDTMSPDEAAAIVGRSRDEVVRDDGDLEALDNASRGFGGRSGRIFRDACRDGTPPPDTVVLYVNGVGNTFLDFHSNRFKLAATLTDLELRTDGVYNTSAIDAEMSTFGGRVCPTISFDVRFFEGLCQVVGGFLIDLTEAGVQKFAAFGDDPVIGIGQARELARVMAQYALAGRKVILVPHSQGNFFTRDALRLLADDPEFAGVDIFASIGVIMTGSPASVQEMTEHLGRAQVVNVGIETDPVARIGDPACQNGCVESPLEGFALNPLRDHNFQFAYLSGDPLARIRQSVIGLRTTLTNPRPVTPAGLIEVIAQWDNQNDIDLAVTESDGSLLIEGAAPGRQGELVATASAVGPERYVLCDPESLRPGTFQIGLRYRSGAGPTEVDLLVRAGTKLRRLRRTLVAGDVGQGIRPVATITTDGAEFTVSTGRASLGLVLSDGAGAPGTPLHGAILRTTSPAGDAVAGTDASGRASLADLPTGPTTITVSRPGYTTATMSLDLAADVDRYLELTLQRDGSPLPTATGLTAGPSPLSASLASTAGATPRFLAIDLGPSGGPWQLEPARVSWLSLVTASGQGSGTAELSLDPSGLAPGIYRTELVVVAPEAQPALRRVAVELTVTP